jgi:Glyoxalase-like domain
MKIKRQIIVFDAADLAAESSFWASLLGGTVEADDDWHSVLVDGEWRVGVQLAPNHVPPRLARRDAAADPSRLAC